MSTQFTNQDFDNFYNLLRDLTIPVFNQNIRDCFKVNGALKTANMNDQNKVRIHISVLWGK